MSIGKTLTFNCLRALARTIPPEPLANLLSAAAGFVASKASRTPVLTKDEVTSIARFLSVHPPPPEQLEREECLYQMDRMAACWPELYREKRWSARCDFSHAQSLKNLSQEKGPFILVTLHYGPVFLLRYWLRELGLPVAGLVGEGTALRSPFRRLKDKAYGGDAPHVFSSQTDLRRTSSWLKDGGSLLVPIDIQEKKNIVFSNKDNFLKLASGFHRWATKYKAPIIPVLIHTTAPFKWEIHSGTKFTTHIQSPESPEEYLASIMNFFLPQLAKTPEQIRREFLDCIVDGNPKNPAPQ